MSVQTENQNGRKMGELSPELMYFMSLQAGLNNVTTVMRKIEQSVDSLLEKDKERQKNYSAINAQLHILQERLRLFEENNPVSIFSARGSISKKLDPFDSKRKNKHSNVDVDELSGAETIHRECLMDHLEEIVKNFDINNNLLIDELLGEDCLTQDEATTIRENPNRKDQVRKLIVNIAKRSKGKFVKFLATIERKEFYPYIAKALKETYERKTSEELGKGCLLCTIKHDVDVKDIVDKLCKHKLVDFDFLDLVVKNTSIQDQSHLWEVIFTNVDNATNRVGAIRILQEALTVKHETLSAKLGQSKFSKFNSHTCLSKSFQFPAGMAVPDSSWRSILDATSSWDERSTTSEPPKRGDVDDTVDGLPLQSDEISSSTTNLPLTVDWVMKHNPLTNVPFDNGDNDASKTIHKKSRLSQGFSYSTASEAALDANVVKSMDQLQESFNMLNPFDNSPASKTQTSQSKEKKKRLRKRREDQFGGMKRLDVEKANKTLEVTSQETQTPETCLENVTKLFDSSTLFDKQGNTKDIKSNEQKSHTTPEHQNANVSHTPQNENPLVSESNDKNTQLSREQNWQGSETPQNDFRSNEMQLTTGETQVRSSNEDDNNQSSNKTEQI